MNKLKVKNYDVNGNQIKIEDVVLKEPLVYILLKKYLKEM